ncbi:MAG: tetratricopeptide repeat protein, partial [Myxococcota bacterium]
MSGVRTTAGLWPAVLGALILVTGCKDDKEPEEADGPQATAGGEAPAEPTGEDLGERDEEGEGDTGDAEGQAAEGDEEELAESPWGATREEQCKPPERKPTSAATRSAIATSVEQARAGKTSEARATLQQAVSADPDAYEAMYNLGVIADRAGEDSQALEHYRKALRIQSDYEKAARGIVAIHLRRGDTDEARRFVEALASQYETNLELQALHAETLVKAERFDEAWKAARKALQCDERFVPAMIALVKASTQQGREELAESVLDQALEITDDNAELHYLKGRMLLQESGRLREAMKHLKRAVELRPSYLEARMRLGVQLLGGGNYDQAVEQFETAAELAPDLVAVHLSLGDAYRASQQWGKAKEEFDRALQMRPDLPEAHFNLALMYMTAGEDFPGLDALQALQEAKKQFKKYRDLMGPRLDRDDSSEQYLADVDRQIERTKRRLEREAAQKEREAERAARQEAEGD